MPRENRLRSMLESLVAEILAADSSDAQLCKCLVTKIEALTEASDAGPEDISALTEACQELQAVDQGDAADRADVLGSVAERLMDLASTTGQAAGMAPQEVDPPEPISNSQASDEAPSSPVNDPQAVNTPATSPAGEALSSLADPELLSEYVAESLEHVVAAEEAVLALEADPNDAEQINTILRAFHTIKGSSAFLGLTSIQHLAHLAESLLARARDGEVQIVGPRADLSLKVCDALRHMIQAAAGGTAAALPAGVNDLMDRLAAEANASSVQTEEEVAESSVSDETPAEVEAPAPTVQADPEELVAGSAGPNQAVATTVRVGTERLDDLVDTIGELVVAHSMVSQSDEALADPTSSFAKTVVRASKIVRELHDTAISLRMVPLKGLFSRMARAIRDLSRQSGKPVELLTSGDETEIDRNIVEALADPLIHMVRNAVDHGIEAPDQRRAAGKDATGHVLLSAHHIAGSVVIEVRDDGHGLDVAKIRAKAEAHGLISADDEMTEQDLFLLVFHPGFSTADAVSSVSGRGVGMDVVRRNIEQIGGRISVESQAGHGARFILRLPLTLAITDAMLVRVGAETYLLPTIAIERAFRPAAGLVSTVTGKGEVVDYDGRLLPVFRLHDLFNIAGAVEEPTEGLLVVISGNGRQCALLVDELIAHQHTVIKSFGSVLGRVAGTAGGAILADGRVGLILDADGLVRLAQGDTNVEVVSDAATSA